MKKLIIGSLLLAGTGSAFAAPQDFNRMDILVGHTTTDFATSPFLGTTDNEFQGMSFDWQMAKLWDNGVLVDLEAHRSHSTNDDDFSTDLTSFSGGIGYVFAKENLFDIWGLAGYSYLDSDNEQARTNVEKDDIFAEVGASVSIGERFAIGAQYHQMLLRDGDSLTTGDTDITTVSFYGEILEDKGFPFEIAAEFSGDVTTLSLEMLLWGSAEDDLAQYGFRYETTEDEGSAAFDSESIYFFIRAYREE